MSDRTVAEKVVQLMTLAAYNRLRDRGVTEYAIKVEDVRSAVVAAFNEAKSCGYALYKERADAEPTS